MKYVFLSFKKNSDFSKFLESYLNLINILKKKSNCFQYNLFTLYSFFRSDFKFFEEIVFLEKSSEELENYKIAIPLSNIDIRSGFLILYTILFTELYKDNDFFQEYASEYTGNNQNEITENIHELIEKTSLKIYSFAKKKRNKLFFCPFCEKLKLFLSSRAIQYTSILLTRHKFSEQNKYYVVNENFYNLANAFNPITFPRVVVFNEAFSFEEFSKIMENEDIAIWLYFLVLEKLKFTGGRVKLSEIELSVILKKTF